MLLKYKIILYILYLNIVIGPILYIYLQQNDISVKRSIDNSTPSNTPTFNNPTPHNPSPLNHSPTMDPPSIINSPSTTCTKNDHCGKGTCIQSDNGENICKCDSNYITYKTTCDYKIKSSLFTLLFSIFLGMLGADWFFLSRDCCGNDNCYTCVGIIKLITAGGLGIWWVVDIIRIGLGVFADSNGIALSSW